MATDDVASRNRSGDELEKLAPTLLEARRQLVAFQKHRSRCLVACRERKERRGATAIGHFLSLNLAQFRLRVEQLALAFVSACGENPFSRVGGIQSPVDLFFGEVMRMDSHANRPLDFGAEMRKLHTAGLKFMETVGLLDATCAMGERLAAAKREFERRWLALKKF